MKNHSSIGYRNVPGGSGFSPNIRGQMIPVAIEDLIANGSRTQRRWAEKELRKLERKSAREASC